MFAGSVNRGEYLADETGNRRFWPVKCGVIDLEGLVADREQIWAEAVHLYQAWVKRGRPVGECLWWPSFEERPLFEGEQAERMPTDVWRDVVVEVANSLKRRTPEGQDWVSAVAVWRAIVEDKDHEAALRADGLTDKRVQKILSAAGWESKRIRAARGTSQFRAWVRRDSKTVPAFELSQPNP